MLAKRQGTLVVTLLLFLTTVCLGSKALADDTWKYSLGVYGWLPNIDVELPTGQKTEITQSDIIDNLSMAAMAILRAQNDRWSLSADMIYFDLSSKGREPLLPRLNLREVELQASLITPTIGYRLFDSGDSWAEVYAGPRYLWLEPSLKYELVGPFRTRTYHTSKSADKWDAVIGFRGAQTLVGHWFVPWGADAGTGQSNSVVQLLAGIGYRFDNIDAVAAWRYMRYDFGNGFGLKTMAINGPLIGIVFKF